MPRNATTIRRVCHPRRSQQNQNRECSRKSSPTALATKAPSQNSRTSRRRVTVKCSNFAFEKVSRKHWSIFRRNRSFNRARSPTVKERSSGASLRSPYETFERRIRKESTKNKTAFTTKTKTQKQNSSSRTRTSRPFACLPSACVVVFVNRNTTNNLDDDEHFTQRTQNRTHTLSLSFKMHALRVINSIPSFCKVSGGFIT